jgi:hypothetical protein
MTTWRAPAADTAAQKQRRTIRCLAAAIAAITAVMYRALTMTGHDARSQTWMASSVMRRAWMRTVTRCSRSCCSAG